MGEEFCTGCKDCTNNNPEDDFSRQANPPLTYLNNPFFNNKSTNSVNDVTQMNNESFLNNYNQIKNDTYMTTNNSRLPIVELEDNKIDKLRSGNNNINNINDDEVEIDKEKLENIQKNYSSRKITKLFRKYLELKNNSHQILRKEYSSIPSSEFSFDLNNEDLDVNLAPEINHLYLGTKFNDKKDGLGLEIFGDTKSKYFGIFRNGKRVDAGRFVINNDEKEYYYFGQVKGIYACGYGWFADGKNLTSYEGMWKNSMKNGYGVEIYTDKSEYRGTFLNGKKDGIGSYRWLDNSKYEGEWKENKLHGYGIYTFKDNSVYKGEFKGNRMDGLGEFSFPGVKTYIGFFHRDFREGFGILIWHRENKAFIGFWKNNQKNGIGKFIVNDKVKYGIWKEDELVEKLQTKMDFNRRLNNYEKAYIAYFRLEEYNVISNLINQYMVY